MIADAPPQPAAAIAATDRPSLLRGTTNERRPVRLWIRGGTIVRVRIDIGRYVCDPEGDIGPLLIDDRPYVAIHASRRFVLSIGPGSQRLQIDGRLSADRRRAGGSARLTGTIGTGDPCRSPRISFRAARPAPA